MLKILKGILFQVFMTPNFFVFFLFFGLIGFNLYYIGLMAKLHIWPSGKKLCVRVCVLRVTRIY